VSQKFRTGLIVSLLVMAAASCSTVGTKSAPAVAATTDAVSPENGGNYVLTRIPEPELPQGKCGMILWTLEQDQPAPVFQYLSGETGRMAFSGEPILLTRQASTGSTAFGVGETQTFTDASGDFKVKVAVNFGLGFDGGTYLERGLITIESADAWRTVTPVAGVAGCRSK